MPAEPDDSIPLAPGVRLARSEVTWRFSASGGPGGQHVNTANTRAEATFDVAASETLPAWARERLLDLFGASVSVAASDTRSQSRNRALALARLAARLRSGLAEQPERRATRPTRASQRRRLDAKRRRGDIKRERRGRPDPGGD